MDPERQSAREIDREVENLLIGSRPQPDTRFRVALRERLLPRPFRRRRPAWKPALAFGGAVLTATVALLTAGLAGGGPLATNSSKPVKADTDCRFVTVKRHTRMPVTVVGRDGRERLELRQRLVERRVKRCP